MKIIETRQALVCGLFLILFLGGRQLALLDGNNPRRAEASVIREELHSLGLGENPPGSEEITARVLALCYP